ncbi:hypothetical protein ACLB2K_029874 [Fragaria x ananassa]
MTFVNPNLDLSPSLKGSKNRFSITPSPSFGNNPSIANMLASSSTLGIQNTSQASVASLALANSNVVNLSDRFFAPPKKKRRRLLVHETERVRRRCKRKRNLPPSSLNQLR